MSEDEPIQSGKQALASIVAALGIDWRHDTDLEIWSVRHSAERQIGAPAGLDIGWMTAAGVRYAMTVVFEDDTWVWTDLIADLDAAVVAVQWLWCRPARQAGAARGTERRGAACTALLRQEQPAPRSVAPAW